MIFVIDSNIIFSGLIKDGKTREILLTSILKFYIPERVLDEIKTHKELIIKKSNLLQEEFELLFDLLISKISVVSIANYQNYMNEALDIMGHIDKDDSPFIALALSIENDGIWSDDLHFKKQSRVKIWTTEEVVKLFETNNDS